MNPIERALQQADRITEANASLERMSRVNNDPDGLECYSDHAHDIRTVGNCMFCDSSDVNVVGHILPQFERYTGKDPVQAAAIVMHTQSAKFFDGVLLDSFSASAIQAIHTKLSATNGDRLRTMTLVQAVDICFRLINDQGKAKT